MNKKLIRLTESDLHRIVKESVNEVLNEVTYNGIALRGDNPADWKYLANVRYEKGDNAFNAADVAEYVNDKSLEKRLRNIGRRHRVNANQNYNNYNRLRGEPITFKNGAKHRREDGTRKW